MALHPELRRVAPLILADFQRATGRRAVVTSGYRSIAHQRRLYEAYRRGGPLAARPGASAHNFGLALDVAIVGAARSDRAYGTLHRIARAYGLTPLSGAQARQDPFHLEVPGWRRYVRRR